MKAFVASIDASPDWAATYRGISFDPATGTGTLAGLSIRNEKTPTHFDFETVSVSGYAEAEFSNLLEGEENISFLPKPIDIKTLAERVKQELQKAA